MTAVSRNAGVLVLDLKPRRARKPLTLAQEVERDRRLSKRGKWDDEIKIIIVSFLVAIAFFIAVVTVAAVTTS